MVLRQWICALILILPLLVVVRAAGAEEERKLVILYDSDFRGKVEGCG